MIAALAGGAVPAGAEVPTSVAQTVTSWIDDPPTEPDKDHDSKNMQW